MTAEAVEAVLEPLTRATDADDAAGHVVLVTDRHGTGTNALALRPPDVIDFAFGPGSRARAPSRAEAAGATYVELDGPLTVDLDTPEDLVFVEVDRAGAPRCRLTVARSGSSALDGIPEIRDGDDLGVFIGNAIQRTPGRCR